MLSEWVFGKAGLLLFGNFELAFRIWPLLFSLIGICGIYFFLLRCSTQLSAQVAILLIAIGSGFIFHSREFKLYTLDLAITAWTLYIAFRKEGEAKKSNDCFLVIVLSLFALTSPVFIFLLPAVAVYRFFHLKKRAIRDSLILVFPVALFIAIYFLFLKPQNPGGTVRFWTQYYPNSIDNINFLLTIFKRDSKSFLSLNAGIVSFSYLVCLLFFSVRKKDGIWLLLLTPFLVHVAVAFFGGYPLFGRSSYFLYGILTIAVAYNLGSIAEFAASRTPIKEKTMGVAAMVTLIVFLLWQDVIPGNIVQSGNWPTQQGRKVLTVLNSEIAKGDVVKFNYGSYYTLLLYKDKVFNDNENLKSFSPLRSHSLNDKSPESLFKSFLKQSSEISVGSRVWFISTHVQNAFNNYSALFRQIGSVNVVVRGAREALILLNVEKPVHTLQWNDYSVN